MLADSYPNSKEFRTDTSPSGSNDAPTSIFPLLSVGSNVNLIIAEIFTRREICVDSNSEEYSLKRECTACFSAKDYPISLDFLPATQMEEFRTNIPNRIVTYYLTLLKGSHQLSYLHFKGFQEAEMASKVNQNFDPSLAVFELFIRLQFARVGAFHQFGLT
ncbi:hypothetical protein M422DRAFT_242647 [Sphaerobolus stellatus SS14]|nr:hypothetical protein M422DRAFT_242647 [Sphaerobolus stellatus SS14]